MKAVCAALRDSSVLVQRCALDFLVVAFPMHVQVITFSDEDRIEVATAATSVLLRRDMSLNRRLYSWLCGSSPDSTASAPKSHKRVGSDSSLEDDTSIYFEHYSRALLIEGLRTILQRSLDSEDQPDLRPYRLLITLLDKPEIGAAILEDIIIDVFRALHHSYHNLSKLDHAAGDVGDLALSDAGSVSSSKNKSSPTLKSSRVKSSKWTAIVCISAME